jgi:hypothetical protein
VPIRETQHLFPGQYSYSARVGIRGARRAGILVLVYALVGAPSLCAGQPSSFNLTSGPMVGFHYGVPLKWSAALGLAVPGGTDAGASFVAAEPGLGGWRASVGYLHISGSLGTGYAARVSYLRTNDRPWRSTGRSSFAGVEGQYMPLFVLGVRIGAFARVAGVSKRGLITADISLML